MAKEKKLSNNSREFLLTFFQSTEGYEEIEVNGFWLIKKWDGNKNEWTVNIFTQESYNNYKRGQQKWQEAQNKLDFIKNI